MVTLLAGAMLPFRFKVAPLETVISPVPAAEVLANCRVAPV